MSMDNNISFDSIEEEQLRRKTKRYVKKGLTIISELGKTAEVLSEIGKVADKYLKSKGSKSNIDKEE